MIDADYSTPHHLSPRKKGKPLGKDAPHIPNKAERKLLTTMMRKSGQTEAEVRASKTNRQKLAQARISMSQPKDNRVMVDLKRAKRRVRTRLPNLSAHDPRIEKIAKFELDERNVSFRLNFNEILKKCGCADLCTVEG